MIRAHPGHAGDLAEAEIPVEMGADVFLGPLQLRRRDARLLPGPPFGGCVDRPHDARRQQVFQVQPVGVGLEEGVVNKAEELHQVRVEARSGRIGFEPRFRDRRLQGFLQVAVAEMQRHHTPGADGAAVEFRSGPTENGIARAGPDSCPAHRVRRRWTTPWTKRSFSITDGRRTKG